MFDNLLYDGSVQFMYGYVIVHTMKIYACVNVLFQHFLVKGSQQQGIPTSRSLHVSTTCNRNMINSLI